jgi:hypothetical protein
MASCLPTSLMRSLVVPTALQRSKLSIVL